MLWRPMQREQPRSCAPKGRCASAYECRSAQAFSIPTNCNSRKGRWLSCPTLRITPSCSRGLGLKQWRGDLPGRLPLQQNRGTTVRSKQPGEFTDELFGVTQPVTSDRLMSAMDGITHRYGKSTLRSANAPRNPEWGMLRELLSQPFTTRLDQLWRVYCK